MLDPKAYFAQWQAATQAAAAAPQPSSDDAEHDAVIHQVASLSAVRCAAHVKEKGQNFTSLVAIEALCTMATKSSYKLREDLFKQPHVKALCKRIQELLHQPPPALDLRDLSRAAEALAKFPEEARGNAAMSMGAIANSMSQLNTSAWSADTASKLLWSMARCGNGEEIQKNKQVVTHVVKELVRDKGRRIQELSYDGLAHLLWAVSRARIHKRGVDRQTVHMQDSDSFLFQLASRRIVDEIERIPVTLLADVVHIHNEIGIKNERLFRAICPKIVSKQKELRDDQMSKCIKAYTRFMIPLKEEAQGFRTMAVVQKGDFLRPSDKPKPQGKKTFDKPQALYPATQLHAK
ncbi:unnamed protein product [Symbiodinium pilosum]|uniref:TOG domain-containing protein n=1 Tax=Symbiodinium pilosum TaxID=2952 RepID=A0A812LB65_SYMPI|nr:unnamed protein product [Symbiodinium pilosum]